MASAEPDASARQAAQVDYQLARAWQHKDRLGQAVLRFKAALDKDPGFGDAYLRLIRIYLQQRRWRDAAAASIKAQRLFPEESEFHKNLVTALLEIGDIEDAFSHYRLERMDSHPLEIGAGEILACVVVRNEVQRLPYFLQYYRELGVDRFLIVDNASSDGTQALLLDQADVHLWVSDLSFKRANFGSAWFELLLRRFGQGHWCLTLDADELLVFPGCEARSLADYCRQLESAGNEAASGILLDMYSDRAVSETHYRSGQDFLEVCRFFDRQYFHDEVPEAGPYRNLTFHFGGARQRVFGERAEYLVTKVPLLKYGPEVVLAGGQHWTSIPAERIEPSGVCVLHFKYFASFTDYARLEAAREEHSQDGAQYKVYAEGLDRQPALNLYDPDHSVQYKDTRQLTRLGLLGAGQPEPTFEFPPIAARPGEGSLPFWSVMITVYDRLRYIESVLQSVLEQAGDDMQIEIVSDGGDPVLQAELRTHVARAVDAAGAAQDRVNVYCHPTNLGHPHIFNLCIERAAGRWVHILHDDDGVRPGFYSELRSGIEDSEAAAAFCRHDILDGDGKATWTSWLEREAPGIIEGWLERIAVECRLQFSAMVVRRSAYEQLGGFCAQAGSAFDWEMWKRIGANYPVWYEPRRLAFTRRDGSTESDGLLLSGGQIADSLKTIAISETYLPRDRGPQLSEKARERFALYGLDLAQKQLRSGDGDAALANIRESLRASSSARVLHALRQALG